MDLTSVHGFFLCLRDTLRLRRNALLWGGVPCSSCLWFEISVLFLSQPLTGSWICILINDLEKQHCNPDLMIIYN